MTEWKQQTASVQVSSDTLGFGNLIRLFEQEIDRSMREMVASMESGIWWSAPDPVTLRQWKVNLFPRARRRYAAAWERIKRVEDAVDVLRHGLPECEEECW